MSSTWPSIVPLNTVKTTIKQQNYRKRLAVRSLGLAIRLNKTLTRPLVSVYLPPMWQLIILRHGSEVNRVLLYFSSHTYFFQIPVMLNNYSPRFDRQTSDLTILFKSTSNYLQTSITLLKRLFYSFTRLFFNKLKFKGKGYYIFKNARNTVTPQFGHAHRIYCYAYNVSVKFLNKTTVFIYGISSQDVLSVSYQIKAMRPINIFTGRGVRFSKQVVYKKTGKVSSYR